MTDIRQQVCHAGPCEINCLTAGDPANRTVLLLHGMKFQAATWQDLGTLQALAGAGFHALAIDMPGFGRSPACSAEQDSVLDQVITMMAGSPPILIGPSMGGRIALEFTIRHPELISAMILVGAVGIEENKDTIAHLTLPTLLVWGSNDQISPLANCELLASSIPGAEKFVIADAAHPCYLDNPETFHAEILRFLANLRG